VTYPTMNLTDRVDAPTCEQCSSVDVYRHQGRLRCLDHLDEWAQTSEVASLARFAAAMFIASDPGAFCGRGF
jgi:hypothetical protein